MNLYEEIKAYKPWNEQESVDQQVMLSMLEQQDNVLFRDNLLAHFSASAWVVNKKHDKVLMIYHNIYHSWSWTGGHADGEEDLRAVALREITEETGIQNLKVIGDDIFSLETITVDGHEKRGKYVPSHLHLNVTYLIEADDTEELKVKPDENSGVKWFPMSEVLKAVSEPWMIERVYGKLMEKMEHKSKVIK